MKIVSLLLITVCSISAIAKDISYFLPQEQFDPSIPTPESVLGYQVGEWHIRHDQLVQYFKVLAENSDRVAVNQIGVSHEKRPLLQVIISSPKTIENINEVRQNHVANIEGKRTLDASDPIIVNLNYSVHGDESSGSNSSLLVAYYLAASSDPKVLEYLSNMVIIIDPSLNPDGLSRFAQWANQFKGKNLNADPNHIEHVQGWTRGRVNHYWFDLNRDWLLLQHPESQARVKQFYAWRPTVLTDHHEMGTNSTFFFQPGIPSRKNPMTPDENVTLTKKLAMFHAKTFDQNNSLYYTEESFDDFYAGKGSTYPDLNGTIGILFEQASSRGHAQESINGLVEFPSTIKHQVWVSLSTIEGSFAHKRELLEYQRDFYQGSQDLAKNDKLKGYLVSETYDKTKFSQFLSLLTQHQITYQGLKKDLNVGNKLYAAEHSVYIPLEQSQYRLIRSIFSEQKSFNDNTFYDVSSWNLAMAYELTYDPISSERLVKSALVDWNSENLMQKLELSPQAVGYAIDWRDSGAAALVYELLNKGFALRSAMKPFSTNTSSGLREFPAGTVLLTKALQKQVNWYETFSEIAVKYNVGITSIPTGLTTKGIDLGSRNMLPLQLPKVLLVGGQAASLYEAGEAWFFMDQKLGFSPTIVDADNLGYIDFNDYTHVMLVDGWYENLNKNVKQELHTWLQAGGILWTQKKGMKWSIDNEWLNASYLSKLEWEKPFEDLSLPYESREQISGRKRVAGAFFNAKIDLSHPLTFGFTKQDITLFKNSSQLVVEHSKPFTLVASYADDVLASGYADKVNQEHIANSAAIIAHQVGRGVIVGLVDNPNFRAFTVGSQRFLVNTLFIGHGIDN